MGKSSSSLLFGGFPIGARKSNGSATVTPTGPFVLAGDGGVLVAEPDGVAGVAGAAEDGQTEIPGHGHDDAVTFAVTAPAGRDLSAGRLT
jgi:hypothetical protein